MDDLDFKVASARPERYAAAPTLLFSLRVSEPTGAAIRAIALRCQISIEPQRRRYTPQEEGLLAELFGETPRWGNTLRPFLWTQGSAMLPGMTGRMECELAVPYSYDLEVGAAKYFHALRDGEIPLLLLFGGTVFAEGRNGLRVSQIPWSKEAAYRLPVRVWRELMDLYFLDSGWPRLRRDTLDALLRFKAQRTLATWDQTLEALLKESSRGRA